MKNQKVIKSLLYALVTTSPVIGITVAFVYCCITYQIYLRALSVDLLVS